MFLLFYFDNQNIMSLLLDIYVACKEGYYSVIEKLLNKFIFVV